MPRPRRLFHGVLAAAVLTPALPAATAAAEGPAAPAPGAARTTSVAWAEGAFRGVCGTRQGGAPDRRVFRFFDDARMEAVASHVTRDRQGTVLWTGHLAGRPDRPVSLAIDGACGNGVPRVAGEVHLGSKRYVIDADRPGTSTVRELSFARTTPLHNDVVRVEPPQGPRTPRPVRNEREPRPRAAITAPVIDLLIGYTPHTVRETKGGVEALDLKVKAAVAGTNAAYSDSTVTARLNLLGTFTTKEWTGDDGDTDGITSALSDTKSVRYSSAFATDARRQRDEKGADLLHVLTQFTPEPGTLYTAGTANTPSLPRIIPGAAPAASSDGAAFGAQQIDTLGTYHLAHEIGHNFGLNHDYRTDPIDPDDDNYQDGNLNPYYPDNHGYLPADRTWTDIMGYTMACADEDKCETKLWFSNPRQTYQDVPRGVALGQPNPADCVRVMNLTGPVLANYRTPPATPAPTARYALTAAPDSPERGSVTPAATGLFDKGDQVTLTAAPKAGYKIDYWAVDGKLQSTRASELTVTMDDNHFVTAKFIKTTATATQLPATITKVSPATGPKAGGFTVTLTGTGLASTTNVYVGSRTATGFSGRPASAVKVVDDSTVTFTMPTWASAATVQIATVANGALTASADFTYTG
ncbi:reprolysin-like metallopeptidase [Streptomyces noboritoensis]|uniref:Reprolysin-like metallopeptidase n=1 Tax=Streptomyces noboritoensis TaxID=67337 RepID=A0ABV6TF83_9ACTN